jgi:hypothetical protein
MRFLLTLSVLSATFLPCAASAQSCREASITEPAPFMGNNDEVFRLDDGSIWKVQFEYQYLYEYYPRVTICPSQGKLVIKGKVLNVVAITPAPRRRPAGPGKARSASEIVVVAVQSGCHDYFVADGPAGFYLLEWYGGHSPGVGDIIVGDLKGYGFRDVFYANAGSKGRVYVDDFLLSRSSAIEKYAAKCS